MAADNMASLNGLRAFDAVARKLSFSQAADELCVTQGAISRQISNLEKSLGVNLFHRVGRQVRLTKKGMQLHGAIGEPFQRIRQGLRTLSSESDDMTLKIKVPPTLGIRWFVPRLSKFHGQHREIDVQITTSHQAVDFAVEDVDVAIYWGFGKWQGLAADFIVGEDLIPVCSPRLLEANPISSPLDFNGKVLLQSMHRTDDWVIWKEAMNVQDINWQQVIKFENSALTYQAAIDHLGVVIAQSAFIEEDLAARRLVAPINHTVPGERAYYLVYPKERATQKKVSLFRAWLLDSISSDTARQS